MNFWNFWNGFATAHTSNNFPCFQVGVTCDRQFSFYRLGLLAGRGLAHSVLGWSCVRSLVQGRSVIRYQQVVTETARKGSSNLLMIWKRWLFTLLCFELSPVKKLFQGNFQFLVFFLQRHFILFRQWSIFTIRNWKVNEKQSKFILFSLIIIFTDIIQWGFLHSR